MASGMYPARLAECAAARAEAPIISKRRLASRVVAFVGGFAKFTICGILELKLVETNKDNGD